MKPYISVAVIVLLILVLSFKYLYSNSTDLLTPKEQLGRYLFFDNRLSINNTKSCASCHNNRFAFTDGYRTSITSLGENVLHNAPSIINSRYYHFLDWAHPAATNFARQIKRPLYGHQPIELGLDLHIESLKVKFENDSLYKHLFEEVYKGTDSIFTLTHIEEAIVAYENRLVSKSSTFDEGLKDSAAIKGYQLFCSNRLNCVTCHPPPYFTLVANSNKIDSVYANTGLYNVSNKNEYPEKDNGLFAITHNPADNGKYRIPSLRNVMITMPYMHDGSVNSIEEVIAIYERGGRNVDYGTNKGDGKQNKMKNKLITGFNLTSTERKELLSFLASLTDITIINNPIFKNPFSNP